MRNTARALLVAAAWLVSTPSIGAPLPEASRARKALSDLETPFEANAGQFDAKVAYAARTFAGTTFVTHDGDIVHAVRGAPGTSGWNLVERLAGGVARPWPTAPSATAVSRVVKGDLRDISTFRAISLGEPWRGIEVSLQAKGANVEKLFTVAPGADPARIRVAIDGADSLTVDESGALVVATAAGPVRFTAPVAWQRHGRDRRPVEVGYVAAGTGYGFRLGTYDRSAPVVIDPLLQSTYFGGGSPFDTVSAVRVDPAGNVYVGGNTTSFDLPGTTGGAQPSPAGFGVYLAKLSPDLKTLIQATYLGGIVNETLTGLVLDAAGNVYVAGSTGTTGPNGTTNDFPGTAGGAQSTYGGGMWDGYVAKLSGDLKSLLQSTLLGGAGADQVTALAIDAAGNVYVAGSTSSTNFPGTTSGPQPGNMGADDAFVARLTGDLKTLVRATYLGTPSIEAASAIAIDVAGVVYVAGHTTSGAPGPDFPGVTAGAQAIRGGGNQDAFISRLSGDLVTLHQSTYLGGNGNETANAIAIGADGSIYVTGGTDANNFPAVAGGALAAKPPASTSFPVGYVARLANDLKSIVQATYLGGGGPDYANDIHLDGTGKVYVVGQAGPFFPATTQTQGGDAFIALLAADLKTLTRSVLLGGSGSDIATRMAFDAAGNVIVAGGAGPGFPGTVGGAQPNVNGGSDGFVARMTADLLGGPATRFVLSMPANAVAGTSVNVTVNAVDAIGIVASGYSGTIHWTSTDPAATLPADATLVNGTGTFPVTFETTGSRTVTATDTVTASITGQAATQVGSRPASQFTVTAPANAFVNQPFTVTATARDVNGNVATSYNGTAIITSSDGAAVLPSFGYFANGVRTFQVTLKTPGSRTVTVTDSSTPSVTGTSGAISVTPPVRLEISAPATAAAGAAFNVTVNARDPADAIVTGYAGTVRITSNDGAAVLPPDATLANGTGTFSVTLKTAGSRTVVANDASNTLVNGATANVGVTAGPPAALAVSAPPGAAPDAAFGLTVTARDAFGNVTPGYSGTVHFTSTDGAATLPADAALANGTGNFNATLKTVGNQTITATDTATASINGTSGAIAVSRLVPSASALDFGGQSMGTTSAPRTLTITNTSGASIAITGTSVSNPQFEQTNDCATLAANATCTVTLVFKPTASLGALGASIPVTATLTLTAAAGNMGASLAGTAERSLVTHYYRAILRRAPDAGGKTYWEGEASRVAALGANVNETWFAMAQAFYFSPEYLAFNRDDTAFTTDLYNTFFNRAPDGPGLAFWLDQLAQGMPREVALTEFMFSTEFRNFAQAIFGNTTVRPEVDLIMDFYRGLLARLPDSTGFAFWLNAFRTAQCQGQASITFQVDQMSNSFTISPEYMNRARSNSQYVGDLYNAFLRRGGDISGVLFWLNRLNTGQGTRGTLRVSFRDSAEFQARAAAVIAQGCFTP